MYLILFALHFDQLSICVKTRFLTLLLNTGHQPESFLNCDPPSRNDQSLVGDTSMHKKPAQFDKEGPMFSLLPLSSPSCADDRGREEGRPVDYSKDNLRTSLLNLGALDSLLLVFASSATLSRPVQVALRGLAWGSLEMISRCHTVGLQPLALGSSDWVLVQAEEALLKWLNVLLSESDEEGMCESPVTTLPPCPSIAYFPSSFFTGKNMADGEDGGLIPCDSEFAVALTCATCSSSANHLSWSLTWLCSGLQHCSCLVQELCSRLLLALHFQCTAVHAASIRALLVRIISSTEASVVQCPHSFPESLKEDSSASSCTTNAMCEACTLHDSTADAAAATLSCCISQSDSDTKVPVQCS